MTNTTFQVRPMERTKQGGMFVKVTVWEPLNVPLQLTVSANELRFEPGTPEAKGSGTKAAEVATRALASLLGAGGAGAAMARGNRLVEAASADYLRELDGGGFSVPTDRVVSVELKGVGMQHRVHLGVKGASSDQFVFQGDGSKRTSEAVLAAVRAVL